MASLQQSAAILASVGALPDLAMVLANLGATTQQDGVLYQAHAAWLATAVHVEANMALHVAATLVQEMGPVHETSLLVSLHAVAAAQQAEHHHAHEQLLGRAHGLVGTCLQARSVPPEQANTWLAEHGLLDLGVIIERLRPGLEPWCRRIVGCSVGRRSFPACRPILTPDNHHPRELAHHLRGIPTMLRWWSGTDRRTRHPTAIAWTPWHVVLRI